MKQVKMGGSRRWVKVDDVYQEKQKTPQTKKRMQKKNQSTNENRKDQGLRSSTTARAVTPPNTIL